jgi:hypothetical protein
MLGRAARPGNLGISTATAKVGTVWDALGCGARGN